MSQGRGTLTGMDTNIEQTTYRNHHGDLMCSVHHTMMMVPPLPDRYARKYAGARVRDPWCTHCRRQGDGSTVQESPDSSSSGRSSSSRRT